MGYGHRYYIVAERLKAVKGYMNAGMTAEEYGKQIGVNPRTLRDWIRAFTYYVSWVNS
jgi:transposase-like protein